MNILIGTNPYQLNTAITDLVSNNHTYKIVAKNPYLDRDINTIPNFYFFPSYENLQKKCLYFMSKETFDYILPTSDIFTPFVSKLNNRFNLKGINEKTSNAVDSKLKQYDIFSYLNIPYPDLYKSSDNIVFPCIVKPSKGSGGKDVQIINSKKELFSFLQNKHEPILLQRFINGNVCSVVGHVRDKKVFIDFLFDIIPYSGNYPAETDLRCPSIYKDKIETELIKYISIFIDYIELNNSPFMLDLVIDKNNQMYFIDFSPRLSITQTLAYYSGHRSYISNLLNSILNGVDFKVDLKRSVIKKHLELPIGVIKSIKCLREDLAEKIVLPKKVVHIKSDSEVVINGYAIVTGYNMKEAETKFNEVVKSISVTYK